MWCPDKHGCKFWNCTIQKNHVPVEMTLVNLLTAKWPTTLKVVHHGKHDVPRVHIQTAELSLCSATVFKINIITNNNSVLKCDQKCVECNKFFSLVTLVQLPFHRGMFFFLRVRANQRQRSGGCSPLYTNVFETICLQML